MGHLRDADLRAYDDDLTRAQAAPTDEIGSIEARRPVGLMRIRDVDGELRFLGDHDADAYLMRRTIDTAHGSAPWWRLEVEFRTHERASDLAPQRGDQVVIAEWPWSSAWVECAPFRPAGAKRIAKDKVTEDWPETQPEDIIARYEAEDWDAFRTDDGFLVAGVSDPSFALDASNEQPRRMRHVFGLVDDFEAAVRRLAEHPHMLRLRDRALAGDLWDYRGATPLVWAGPRVEDDVASAFDLAVRQALAGPSDEDGAHRLSGEPVYRLADEIFREHLSRWRKADHRRKKRARAASSEILGDVASVTGADAASIEEEVDRLVKKLGKHDGVRRQVAELVVRYLLR